MSIRKTKSQLTKHKTAAVNKLGNYIDTLINSPEAADQGRADKLSYWVEDYVRLLKKEETFDPNKTIRYKKGDIVKVHLGYRLGSEEGGLHFAIVLDVNNHRNSNTITVIPLTSQKEGKKAHANSVVLNDELFKLVISKHDKVQNSLDSLKAETLANINQIEEVLKKDPGNPDDEVSPELQAKYEQLVALVDEIQGESKRLSEIRKSVMGMKEGSIALVDQIVTISKLRIYDPIYSKNVLYGIRLSPATLDLIDEKLADLFLRKKNTKK